MVSNERSDYFLYGRSRRYERYAARIDRLREVMDRIRRHRAVLALTGAVVLGLVLCLLSLMGHFTGAVYGIDHVYGERPDWGARAFLSEVRYQFSPAGGDPVWSDAEPVAPGEYRIRAVSKNGFGLPRYSNEAVFTLAARDLTVSVGSADHVYGDSPESTARANTRFEGLAPGDRVDMVEYAIDGDEREGFSASVKCLRIMDETGRDVTAGYAVTASGGCFTMVPRPITVSSADEWKLYDGQPWDEVTAKITGGSLAPGDALRTALPSPMVQAGAYPLTPVCTVLDQDGNEVTGYYDITILPGTLTIAPCPITVQTGSAEKVYDGTPLTNAQWSVVGGEPLVGHTLSGRTTGSQTGAGEGPNTVELTVMDTAGTDVSANYEFITVEGTLKVTPIHLKFETDSAEKVYDGAYLTEDGCRLVEGEVLEGHELQLKTLGRQCDVGSSLNNLKVTILDHSNDKEVTYEGYTFQVDYGVLTVTPRPITVRSGSAEKLYDGIPLTCSVFELIEGSLALGEKMSPTFTGSQTRVGSSSNYFKMYILDGGSDSSSNYDIRYHYGTLTVHENPNLPQQGGDQPQTGGDLADQTGIGKRQEEIKIDYPGQGDQTVYAWVESFDDLGGSRKVYFRDSSYGDYTGSGWAAPELYMVAGDSSPLSYVGTALFDQDVCAYLELTLNGSCPRLLPYYSRVFYDLGMTNDCYLVGGGKEVYGVYTRLNYAYHDLVGERVVVSDLQGEAMYRQYVYQTYLQIPESTKKELMDWAARNGIRADSGTLVEDIQNAVQNAAVYNSNGTPYPQGVDVAVYFLTQAKEGICQHFATAATLMYRAFGIPARYTVGFVDMVQYGRTTELTGSDAHAWVEIYVSGLGWVPMEVTGFAMPQEQKTELHLQAYSAVKYYDGRTFESYDLERYSILSGALQPGHRMEVFFETGRYAVEPGEYVNQITKCVIYDEQGTDVTEAYSIYLNSGTLRILKRQITVTIGSASRIYDGTALSCPTCWISAGSLAPGDTLSVEVTAVLTDPGRMENTASGYQILCTASDGSQVDVTYRYEVIIVPGYLEVTPAED